MHGRERREGQSSNRRKSGCGQRHMRSVPLSVTTSRTVVAGDSAIASVTSDSFCKDGRRISVGDCALFKPPHDSPPFVGIIRHLISTKESTLQLAVNWLYRPAELKLGKGILLEAAPNEVFYSFHRDEIPAASLLHPCKVAFLPKGVQLPTGISSFVCRRVYDIANKCLWWLTDQDYINDRQEEIDQLLYKTQSEMHASVQSGGRSPKPINVPTSASQLKPGTDNMPNNASPLPTQGKGKKRERVNQGLDSVKRERPSKGDEGDSGLYKTENFLKFEISKITEKGGLVDSEGVEKLIQLMQPDRGERKMDLISRSILAGVIAATDRFDCLNRFVQLRGLPVLDEWLQDIHKGKVGDGGSPKDSDKSVEEFLLVLLRALDKLPINLNALQTWHIGKSVNHLRSHKNMEIQKKARSLVDTWKKRVEAEMNMIDSKSVSASWSTKSRLPESAIKNASGSTDVATRSSITQISASKPAALKPSQVETTAKSASSSPGPIKSASSPAAAKDGQSRNSAVATSDVPLMTREDKSSSSSQSHNHSQSFSGKEDARSSTAGSMSVNKLSSSGSRHKKSINGYPGASVSGGQKETSLNRSSSLHRNSTSEKFSQSGLNGDKPLDMPVVEGANHKLIVKIPNRGRSPAQSASGGSLEDPAIMNSRASSPVFSEKHDQFNRNLKDKSDALRYHVSSDVNAESWQSNDFKDVLTGSDEGDGSPAGLVEEDRSRAAEDARKLAEIAKAASSSSGNDLKSGKLRETSFSSMNALIESCVKYSEANTSIGDTVGMNLLASVATEEMCKSGLVSPADSAERGSRALEELCMIDDAKSKSQLEDNLGRERSKRSDDTDVDREKEAAADASRFEETPNVSEHVKLSGDRKAAPLSSVESLAPECIGHINPSSAELAKTADPCLEVNEKADSSPPATNMVARISDGELHKTCPEEKAVFSEARSDCLPAMKLGASDNLVIENKADTILAHVEDSKQNVEISSKDLPFEDDCKTDLKKELDVANGFKAAVAMNSEFVERTEKEVQKLTRTSKDVTSEHVSGLRTLGTDENEKEYVNESERKRFNQDAKRIPAAEDQVSFDANTEVSNQKGEGTKVKDENNISEHQLSGVPREKESYAFPTQEVDKGIELKESKCSGIAEGRTEECTSTAVDASSLPALNMVSKMKFDLNEGFVADEGKYGDHFSVTNPGGASTIHKISQLTFAVSSVSTSLPASITVAAAAKGPFVPPEDLLRCKGEIGWKGSAATSAFRPAEPRKVPEMPMSSANLTQADATGRRIRPPLEFDLNVPDERAYEDITYQDSALHICSTSDAGNILDVPRNELSAPAPFRNTGGLDLDLNRVDEASDVGQSSVSGRLEGPALPVKSALPGGLRTGEVRRDFDLNDGPSIDDPVAEQSSFNQSVRGSMHLQPSVAGLRLNNPELGIFSSWFTSGNTYSTVTIPSILPDRGDQPFPIIPPGAPQRILGPAAPAFAPDIFRGSVLSSASVVPFQSGPFQYPVFPFGATFPLPSAIPGGSVSYVDSSSGGRPFTPPMNAQLLGPVGPVTSQYARPYVVSLPDSSANNSSESNRKRGRQGLDLNAGPGALDIEVREDILPVPSRQLPVASSQALAEEQSRMYSTAGGVLKRKEPEGGWDSESFRFKQPSWQ